MKDGNVNSARAAPALPSTASEFIRGMGAGEAEAWALFASVYVPVVCEWCMQFWKLQEADARDVTQNVFIRVRRKFEKFRTNEPGFGFRKWLMTIAIRSASDLRRKQRRLVVLQGESTAATIDEGRVVDEALRRTIEGKQELPVFESERSYAVRQTWADCRGNYKPINAEAFELFFTQGKSAAEIAAIQKRDRSQVDCKISQIASRLRKTVAERFPDLFKESDRARETAE